MALPCVHGGMGIIGYKNHLKTNPEDHKTLYVKYHVKLGFLSGLSTKNHHQNLSPFCRHSHFSGMGAQPPTEFEDYAFRRHKSQMFQGFESYDDLISPFVGGIAPFPGPLDGPRLTEAARMAVELHNNQQATDAGVKNTYQAKVYSSIQKKWTLYLCRLAPQIPLVKKGDGDELGEEDPNSSSNAYGGYMFY